MTDPDTRPDPTPPGADPEPDAAVPEGSDPDLQTIELVSDELALARAQIDGGLAALAEGTLARRLARLEAEGAGVGDESDAARALLGEALWRQGRPMAGRVAIESIRPSSPQRRLPMSQLVEAEGLAAVGEQDRAAGMVERVVTAIGVDRTWELHAGVPGRVTWPLPGELRPEPPRPARPPWSTRGAADAAEATDGPPDDERVAAGRYRLEEARVAYVAGELARGDAEMSIAVRLDPGLAADGVGILEPTLGTQPAAERLLLYGDLLRAAGRELEATDAYDRAADRVS